MKEKIEFAYYVLIKPQFEELMESDEVKPFKLNYMITDFENKKDYELTLEFKEV